MDKPVIRVLVLDGHRPSGCDRMEDLDVRVVYEGHDALHRPGDFGGYRVTQHSLDLAAAATPALYDAVIIGNNERHGLRRAAALPVEMRPRTLIVWSRHDPTEETPYRQMGFTHFGQRYSREGECPLGVREFLREVAAEMAQAQ